MKTVEPRKLTEDEYLGTMISPMQNVTDIAADDLDIWPYVGAVSATDLEGHVDHEDFVECVYRSSDGVFEHVLVMTRTKDIYLVVIVDRFRNAIFGHHLLDPNEKYGLG